MLSSGGPVAGQVEEGEKRKPSVHGDRAVFAGEEEGALKQHPCWTERLQPPMKPHEPVPKPHRHHHGGHPEVLTPLWLCR